MDVLIADDEAVSRKLVRAVLEAAGHDVRAFGDGDALVEAFAMRPSAVVVTDWRMPRLDGIEVCERIRAMPGTRAHVIMLTTISSVEATLEAFRAGADDLITKPFDPALFQARLAAVERAWQRQEDLALREALEVCRSSATHDQNGLHALLDRLVANGRRKRAFARCRAFLRRQLAAADRNGALTRDHERLRAELRELEALEEEGV